MSVFANVLGLIPGTLRFKKVLRSLRTVASVSSLAVFLLLGCSRSEPKADLVIINGAEPGTLDPALVTVQADSRIVRALFEGLTRLDPKTATAIPGLAERWEISPDGINYTFHLRTNAVWSTGEPITTADVVYSWRRVLDPMTASEYAGQLFFVKNAEDFSSGKIKDPARRRIGRGGLAKFATTAGRFAPNRVRRKPADRRRRCGIEQEQPHRRASTGCRRAGGR